MASKNHSDLSSHLKMLLVSSRAHEPHMLKLEMFLELHILK